VKKLILVGSPPFEETYVKELRENRFSRLSAKEQVEFNSLLARLNSPFNEEKDNHLTGLGELISKTDNYQAILIETEEHDTIPTEGHTFQSVWNEASNLRKTGLLLEFGKRIECHVIAIHGDHDPHPAVGVKLPLSQVLNSFKFYILHKCGHSPWKERYAIDRFYKIIHREIC
jgi:DNA repair exonuclease SbcCD nuclease subunit